jgi:hypothetical protein
MLAVFACARSTARADYVNPPGWEQDPDFTHQTWAFDTDALPLAADGGASNPFGTPTMSAVYLVNPSYMFWVWDMMLGGTRHGMWGGMAFGAAPDDTAMAETFLVPGVARPAPWHAEVWIQATYWGSTSLGGQTLTVEIARDAAFQDVYVTYDAAATDIEDQSVTGSGSTGQYWRFTHTFSLPDEPGDVYVRVSLVPGGSMAVFIDQLSIDMRGVLPGDYDRDGDVDPADFAFLPEHVTGPENGPAEPAFDFDGDDDVDLADVAAFGRVCAP